MARRAAAKRWSLRRRLLVALPALATPLLVVAVIGGLLLKTSNAEFVRSSDRVRVAAQIAVAQESLTNVTMSLTDPKLLAGDPAAAMRVQQGVMTVNANLEGLVRLVAGPSRPLAEQVRREWQEAVSAMLAVRMGTPAATARFRDPVVLGAALSGIGGRLMRAAQTMSTLASDNAAALQRELAGAHDRQARQQQLQFLLALLGLLAAVATARGLYRAVAGPLARLRRGAERLGGDDLGHRVPEGGISELASVADAFNAMATRLQDGRKLLASREARFRALVQHASDLVLVTEVASGITSVTPAVTRVLGYRPEEWQGTRLIDLVHPEDRAAAMATIETASRAPGLSDPVRFRLPHASGKWRQMEMVANNLLEEPAVGGLVLTVRDISEQVRLQDQLAHQAFHDDLTGLANRALFADRLEHALTRRATGPDDSVGLVFIDLDDFKTINDTLGHSAGNEVLVALASRIRGCLRAGDTAARMGGDEFAVLLEHVSGLAEVNEVAERILAAVRSPLHVGGVEVFPQASLGISVGASADVRGEDLLQRADTAMYQAKHSGKDTIAVFTDDLAAGLLRRLEIKTDLQRALARGEFEVHYQPTISFASGEYAGVEALLRWTHPVYGPVSPAEFIPLAEEAGLIHRVGAWVLRQACQQAATWARQHPDAPPTVSVNLSGRQLERPDVVDEVTTALAESGLPAHLLVLEITESVVLKEADELLARLHALKDLGVRLAIDDFGTGYSALSYLQRLPVDILKVDKSFVDRLADDEDGFAVAATIINLAHTLRLSTVAEGVEKHAQADLLQKLRCDLGQGYLFARPLPAAEVTALLGAEPAALVPTQASASEV